MQVYEITYKINTSRHDIIKKLQTFFNIHQETVPPHIQTFYDTFDWRLYQKGSIIREVETDADRLICWETLPDIKKPVPVVLPHTWRLSAGHRPAFARDLPDDRFRDSLAMLIEMRRLLPIVQLKLKGYILNLLDPIQKTVARVIIEKGMAEKNGKNSSIGLLRLVPIRGYEKAYWRVRNHLETDPGLTLEPGGKLTHALKTVGCQPGDYSAKPSLNLNPEMPAAIATHRIYQTLFRVMCANEAGIQQNLDPEFLHDFRVSVRRTRSALSQIKHVFPPKMVKHFLKEFAWLGQVTGPTRDLDVHLLKMDDYKMLLPNSIKDDLLPLYDFIYEKQQVAHRQLIKTMASSRYIHLKDAWHEFLKKPPNFRPINARKNIQEVASARIWRVYQRLYKNGSTLTPDSPAEGLHNLRKQGKKLRYLMEFFQNLYPSKKIKRLTRTLKRLQDNLGDFNDYEVQQVSIRGFADQMILDKRYPASTLLAMGYLVEYMERSQKKEQKRFQKCFSEFSTQTNQKHFQRLFKPGP